jgi:hypothetical protein
MRLIDNWRSVLKHAWSVRLGILAGLFQGLDIIMQLTVGQMGEVSVWLRALAGLSAMAAFVSRFVAQPKTIGGGDE